MSVGADDFFHFNFFGTFGDLVECSLELCYCEIFVFEMCYIYFIIGVGEDVDIVLFGMFTVERL